MGIRPWRGRSCASLFGLVFRALDQRPGFAMQQPGDEPVVVVTTTRKHRKPCGIGYILIEELRGRHQMLARGFRLSLLVTGHRQDQTTVGAVRPRVARNEWIKGL